SNRALFCFAGAGLTIDGDKIPAHSRVLVRPDAELVIESGDDESEILLLQGKPINEPVAQYGPFVMNNKAEIQLAFMDYEKTRFGGWPWKSDGPVHERARGRWARWPDGHEEDATARR
ncbi:MAG TPA: pirin-like C-terminal cupin domain-containing protein, partial [Myxococcota bacterium]